MSPFCPSKSYWCKCRVQSSWSLLAVFFLIDNAVFNQFFLLLSLLFPLPFPDQWCEKDIPSASRQCLFWCPVFCSWLFWRNSRISFHSNRIIIGINVSEESSWLTNVTSWILFWNKGFSVMKRCPCCLGVLTKQSGALCHYVWKGYCSVANRDESEVFGRAHQLILGCPRTCSSVQILSRTWDVSCFCWELRLGMEGDRGWTQVRMREWSFATRSSSLSHWQVQWLWMTHLSFIAILFSSLCLSVLNMLLSCIPVREILLFTFIWHQKIKRKPEAYVLSLTCTTNFCLNAVSSNFLLKASLYTSIRSLQGESWGYKCSVPGELQIYSFFDASFLVMSYKWSVSTTGSWASHVSLHVVFWACCWVLDRDGGPCLA